MKRISDFFTLFLVTIFLLISAASCKEKEPSPSELAVGNWVQSKKMAHILWVTNPKGEWNSSVKILDVAGIVISKGSAKGTWQIAENQMIVTVLESEVDKIWEKNTTLFFDIVEVTESTMQLREESGRISAWQKTISQKSVTSETLNNILPISPMVVNLNKNRSNDKDRYLCLNMNMILEEVMAEQEILAIHPKAREAAVVFLSSLVFDDVKDFTGIEEQNKKLVAVLNPYMKGMIKEIKIEHVIVTTEVDQMEEFIIEHTIVEETSTEEGEGSEDTEESK